MGCGLKVIRGYLNYRLVFYVWFIFCSNIGHSSCMRPTNHQTHPQPTFVSQLPHSLSNSLLHTENQSSTANTQFVLSIYRPAENRMVERGYLCGHPLTQNTKIDVATQMRRGLVFRDQPRQHPIVAGLHRSPIFGVSMLFMHTPFDAALPNLTW